MMKMSIGGLKMSQNNKIENLNNALCQCWTLTEQLENSLNEKTKYNKCNTNEKDFSNIASKLIDESSNIPELNFCDMTHLKKLFINNYFIEGTSEAQLLHAFGFGKENNPQILCVSNKSITSEEEQYLLSWLKPIKLDLYKDCYTTSLIKGQDKRKEELNSYFLQQLKLIKPQVIFALGKEAMQFLNGKDYGKFFTLDSTVCIATYNLSEVLKDQNLKSSVWRTLLSIAKYLKIQR